MSDPAGYTRQIELGKLIVTQYIKARPDSANQIYATMKHITESRNPYVSFSKNKDI